MITALWLLAGVLLLMCVVGYSYRGSGPAGLDPKDDVGGLLTRWLWVATAAVALIAAGVTVERVSVSSEELQEAATAAAARSAGLFEVDGDWLAVEIADELGRDVTVTDLDRTSDPDDSAIVDLYLVTAGDEIVENADTAAREDDAVCVEVSIPNPSDTVAMRYQLAHVDSYGGTCP